MKEILPAIPLPDNYRLNEAFSDDFEGDRLDGSKWNPLCPWFLGRLGAFYFDPGNVAVKDGLLRLSARMPEKGSAPLQHQLTHSDRFSTAFVQSRARIRYGYFETRCRCMKANVCNAFWLHDPLDPPAKWLKGDFSEEIDIFEVFGNPAVESRKREYLMTVHKYFTPYIEATGNADSEATGSSAHLPFEFHEDFHRYSLLWTSEKLSWFADGKLLYELPNTYHFRAMHLNFDCEVMLWEGIPLAEDLPAEFDIDYVRVWQEESRDGGNIQKKRCPK